MFDRKRPLKNAATVFISTSLIAGCSALSGEDGEEEHSVVVGTTSEPSVLDPAAAWDGSWELYKNVFQTLLHFPNSSTSPEPDAAKRCGFTDSASRVYRCTLKDGLKFSNGNALDSTAVKHSIDRIAQIDAESGPLGLLGSLDRVETPDKRTVVFHLKKSDATFPFILATPATSLVDPESYPANSLRKGNDLVGSGPYTLESYKDGDKAVLKKYAGYEGPAEIKNDAVTIDYFQDSSNMVAALKDKKIDLALRGLTPKQITGFQEAKANGNNSIELSEMLGSEIRYLVFNPKDSTAGNPAVRKAVAQLIDRKALVRNVYERTADPLYSMVPGGITGHTSAYYDAYGEPSKQKAKEILAQAGISKKVPLTLWYTTDRYGSATEREFTELKRQLEESGLFSITVKGRPWNSFQKGYAKGEYPVFGRGWFPDFPDADNYIAPFVGQNNAVSTPYETSAITDDLLPRSRKESDRAVASRSFTRAQKIIAKDARLIPLWQGRLYIASLKDMAGVEWLLDPSALPRVWELHKKSSW
ncbi:ABC transporter substrate-binding protein [Streptomyces sp. NPDC054796]